MTASYKCASCNLHTLRKNDSPCCVTCQEEESYLHYSRLNQNKKVKGCAVKRQRRREARGRRLISGGGTTKTRRRRRGEVRFNTVGRGSGRLGFRGGCPCRGRRGEQAPSTHLVISPRVLKNKLNKQKALWGLVKCFVPVDPENISVCRGSVESCDRAGFHPRVVWISIEFQKENVNSCTFSIQISQVNQDKQLVAEQRGHGQWPRTTSRKHKLIHDLIWNFKD